MFLGLGGFAYFAAVWRAIRMLVATVGIMLRRRTHFFRRSDFLKQT